MLAHFRRDRGCGFGLLLLLLLLLLLGLLLHLGRWTLLVSNVHTTLDTHDIRGWQRSETLDE